MCRLEYPKGEPELAPVVCNESGQFVTLTQVRLCSCALRHRVRDRPAAELMRVNAR